ncbi:hypothetical protein [Porticoccus sp.]|uniref:DUF6908 domain-containing protein n=1 Tax=Porticoccus sp. TaxID=2024853 RepID=UPI000C37CF1A|nr:hypothetical protein [Porticoccus sp.]MAZ69091.1 hypothetical protein [Porticoccus sp.]|tara:strand:+ start:28 stop:447 length:420 start_codon:yes stop_codon:yes gene_type:complete
MRKTIYETNYDRLVKLGVVAKDGVVSEECRRSEVAGLMDWVVERLPHLDGASGNDSGIAVSMGHYFEQNGDVCKDPEIVVLVYPSQRMVEAFTFEMSLPPIYQQVFPEPGKFYPQLRKELNSFLRQWLNNLIEQRHSLS